MRHQPPNKPAAPNPAITSRLDSGDHWRGVGEPGRSREIEGPLFRAEGPSIFKRSGNCAGGGNVLVPGKQVLPVSTRSDGLILPEHLVRLSLTWGQDDAEASLSAAVGRFEADMN